MALHENIGLLRAKDSNGNTYYMYPITKISAIEGLSDALEGRPHINGTVEFSELASLLETSRVGDIYNISDSFTTDSSFKTPGVVYAAGTNVYKLSSDKWDCLIGPVVIGVKGESESSYRVGQVNITKNNIGLGNVDNTSDLNKPISTATQNALNAKADALTTYEKTDIDNALSNKADANHTHNYAGSASPGGSANSAVKATQDGNGNNIAQTYKTKAESANVVISPNAPSDTNALWVW